MEEIEISPLEPIFPLPVKAKGSRKMYLMPVSVVWLRSHIAALQGER